MTCPPCTHDCNEGRNCPTGKGNNMTKEALAQTQEPVAWMFQHDETGRMNYVSNDGIHNPTMFLEMNPRYALVCPLYTTPPQCSESFGKPSAWVGLTNNELQPIADEYRILFGGWVEDFARAIEAKLKEKNT
jgi:hypothetical protein